MLAKSEKTNKTMCVRKPVCTYQKILNFCKQLYVGMFQKNTWKMNLSVEGFSSPFLLTMAQSLWP